jgi:hypothetical protein
VTARSLIGWTLLGIVLGAGWALIQPRHYVAQVTVYFPSVQPELFLNLTQALRADPARGADLPNLTGRPDVSQVASVVFRSAAAAEFALKRAGQDASAAWKMTDPVSALQARLQVQTTDPSTLQLRLESRSGNDARVMLQAVLDYYSDFVKKTPLTRVRSARESTEARLAKVVKYLRLLEEKMTRSTSAELRALGDQALKANPKVMTQVWLRRMDEESRGRELLDKLQRIRGNRKPGDRSEEVWLTEWARGQKANPRPSQGLMRPVRSQDLQQRAQLEREYYEALLKHRSLVLQHSFLLTWESLENHDFEIIDPLNVRSSRVNWMLAGLVGGGVGLVVALLLALRSRPRRRRAVEAP